MTRWKMTFAQWARHVDAAIVDVAPGHRYALRGRTTEMVARGEDVPSESFEKPNWVAIPGFVTMQAQDDESQVKAHFIPTVIEDAVIGAPQVRTDSIRFYNRDEDGGSTAATEVARFLTVGTVPPTDA